MIKLSPHLIFAITGLVLCSLLQYSLAEFKIEDNTFLLDGEPFRYISGSIHYFRVPREYWRDRLRKMRAAGLNAISTYVEWSSHERIADEYDFSGNLNITEFIRTAEEEGLLVILRVGPYICGERDMGGLPYWLLQFYPDIYLRSTDPNYSFHVERWLEVLFNEVEPLWNGNGGPIIMAQIENEFGNYGWPNCDYDYTNWLRDVFRKYVGDKAVLFTTDGAREGWLNCGKIEGVYATVDFGVDTDVTALFKIQRQFEPQGPLVNSEFYPGWLVHWGEKMANVATSSVTKTLREILGAGANVNFYMFHGGSNFGFTAGANKDDAAHDYTAHIQSYDFDAPISEAGDLTEKYWEIQKVISEYLPLPNISVANSPKGNYGEITVWPVASLFAPRIRSGLGSITHKDYPSTFEAVGQNSGYMLYETVLPKSLEQWLWIENFSDLAHVYVNEALIGNLSREFKTNSLQIPQTQNDDKLSIVVENLGRINIGHFNNDSKGILSNVTLGSEILKSWDQTSFEFYNFSAVEECYWQGKNEGDETVKAPEDCNSGNGFMFYVGDFQLNPNLEKGKKEVLLDTYLNVSNLEKGLVFVNGFNIGRCWPARGPQFTLYIPGVYLRSYPETNVIVVMDEEVRESQIKLSFTTEAILDRG